MEEQKSSNKKILIGVLLALLVGIGAYTFKLKSDNKASEEFLKQEKEQILGNLTAMEEKYDTAIASNNSMTEELTAERDRIISFKDSVKNLKAANWSLIRRYKGKIKGLAATNERLLFKNDSLTIANNLLVVEKDSITGELIEQTSFNDTLVAQNLGLSKKVEIGGAMRVSSVKATAMRLRSNGKYSETNKAQKSDAIRVSFKLLENEIATPGEKQVYIVVKNPKGVTISEKGKVALRDGSEVGYTDQTIADYKNADLNVVMFVDKVQQKFVKGVYTVMVYVDGKLVGASKLQLKDAFLGL